MVELEGGARVWCRRSDARAQQHLAPGGPQRVVEGPPGGGAEVALGDVDQAEALGGGGTESARQRIGRWGRGVQGSPSRGRLGVPREEIRAVVSVVQVHP
jgi:hypothetical protein